MLFDLTLDYTKYIKKKSVQMHLLFNYSGEVLIHQNYCISDPPPALKPLALAIRSLSVDFIHWYVLFFILHSVLSKHYNTKPIIVRNIKLFLCTSIHAKALWLLMQAYLFDETNPVLMLCNSMNATVAFLASEVAPV